jgi:hypothetical protein
MRKAKRLEFIGPREICSIMHNLIRNRVTERDIRDWLQNNGYEGGSAKLESVELHAIQRPGWKQLFRFAGMIRRQSNDADDVAPKVPVWGAVLDDERQSDAKRTQVFLFETEQDQLGKLKELSSGMLTSNRSGENASVRMLFVMAFFAVLVFLLIAMVKSFYE